MQQTMCVNAQQQLILVVEHPILVLAVCVSVVQEMLAVFREKLVVLVLVCVVPVQHVLVKQLVPTVMQRTTYVNAQQLYLLAVGHPILVLAVFVSVARETQAAYQVKLVAQVTACVVQHQVALDLQQDHIATLQTIYVNVQQQ